MLEIDRENSGGMCVIHRLTRLDIERRTYPLPARGFEKHVSPSFFSSSLVFLKVLIRHFLLRFTDKKVYGGIARQHTSRTAESVGAGSRRSPAIYRNVVISCPTYINRP